MWKFTDYGLLTPAEGIWSSSNELYDTFVGAFPASETRSWLFQALSHPLDIIARFQRCLTAEREHGTSLVVGQYEDLLKKRLAELAELMDGAPDDIKHEVIAHQE